ncbi:hypothetical protein [Nonomuraea dietziae]|uniref:hypothetical protein n=1 Tax=Nonomuraea dietziae TaxID=65515 RepID=UPI0034055032
MDRSRQSLTFTSEQPIRGAAQTLAAALGIVLEEKHHDQGGISFHARGPSGESIGVMDTDAQRARFDLLPAEQREAVIDSIPREPTRVLVHSTSRAGSIIDALTSAGFTLTSRDPHPPADVQEADAAWQRLLSDLRSWGWEIEITGFAAPIQLEGALPSGDRFYYRCRWDTCSLDIGGDDPAAVADWTHEQIVEGDHAASYLRPDEAVRILLDLHTQWLRQTGAH